MKRRPFLAPHHTISDAGMVSGSTIPSPATSASPTTASSAGHSQN
ncbi:MAG TPA: ATP-binding protein [Gemmataceae bacterium]